MIKIPKLLFLILLPALFAAVRSPAAPVRGQAGDLWADVVLGQKSFSGWTINEPTDHTICNPGGVVVDRSSTPERLYVLDSGNNRILGFSDLGVLHPNQPVTAGGFSADIVLGQEDYVHVGSNRDSSYPDYPLPVQPGADTLCSIEEEATTAREGGGFCTMAVDASGNLFVPDIFNNRVIRYHAPISSHQAADAVWGRGPSLTNFTSGYGTCTAPTASNICFYNCSSGGAAVDPWGNLWVADSGNNRVLRFPDNGGTPAAVADVVLGQTSFTSNTAGTVRTDLTRLRTPNSIRVDAAGNVFVIDFWIADCAASQGRVMVYHPTTVDGYGHPAYPATGMAASGAITQYLSLPMGLETDPAGGIWVNDFCLTQEILFDVQFAGSVMTATPKKVLMQYRPVTAYGQFNATSGDGPNFDYPEGYNQQSIFLLRPRGGIGVDRAGDVFVGFVSNAVYRYPAPFPTLPPTPTPGATGQARSADVSVFKPRQASMWNDVGDWGMDGATGVAVAGGQLVVATSDRLMYWNMPGLGPSLSGLTDGKPVDGFAGVDAASVYYYQKPYSYDGVQGAYQRIREDHASPQHLWVVRNTGIPDRSIQVYQLPLTSFAAPITLLKANIPLLGAPASLVSMGPGNCSVAPDIDGAGRDYLWVADCHNNRVFRVRNPLTAPQVDILLGQPSAAATYINYVSPAQYGNMSVASASSLYAPGNVELDPDGNLYVSDFMLEYAGNQRLLRFDRDDIQNASPSTPRIGGISASAVFGRADFSSGYGMCPPVQEEINPCGPFEPAFSPLERVMVLGTMYIGSHFPIVFTNPGDTPPDNGGLPVTYMKDRGSVYYSGTFDDEGNLYVTDLNKNRCLVYWHPFLTPSATPTPTATGSLTSTPSPTPSATSTETPSPTRSLTPTETPSATMTATSSLTSTFTTTSSSTPTPSMTPSPTPTLTPSWTRTPSLTPSPTSSQTHTFTSSWTATMSSTTTASPTASQTPTFTPTSSSLLSPPFSLPYPNPSLGGAAVAWDVLTEGPARVRLDVFTTAMRRIASRDEEVPSGGRFLWDLADSRGKRVASGVYFARVRVVSGGRSFEKIDKLVVLR